MLAVIKQGGQARAPLSSPGRTPPVARRAAIPLASYPGPPYRQKMGRVIAALLLLLVGACQQDEPPPLNFNDYKLAFNMAISSYFQRCGLLDPGRAKKLEQTGLLSVAPDLQTIINEEVQKGRTRLTTDCFAPLASAPCNISDAYATIEDCIQGGKEYIPQVKPGQLCRLQGECIGGFCDLGAVKKPCGMGVCTAYVKIGNPCGTGPGKGRCNPDEASCWMGTCRARGAQGDCVTDVDCAASSTCRSMSGGGRQCGPRQKDLPTGSTCDPGQSPAGCKGTDRCIQSSGDPMSASHCTPTRNAGQPCLMATECGGSLVCSGADLGKGTMGQCRAQGAMGQSCDADSICQLTLYCSPMTNTCQPAGETGAPCEMAAVGGQACLNGLCDGGVCRALGPEGSSCQSGADCSSGICDRTNHCSAVCARLQ